MINRDADGNAVLTCDVGDGSDLTLSWYKEDKIIQNEKKIKLLLTSAQVQENKPYSCSVSNPVSSEQSDSVTVSCKLFLFQMFLICRQTCCFCASLSHLIQLQILICIILKYKGNTKTFNINLYFVYSVLYSTSK